MTHTLQQEIHILHIDDEPDFVDLVKTLLEREDDRFTVETATNPDEGLERIGDRPPDCVVSDYNMPGMDGVEFLRALREEHPNLPFILFTGRGSEAVASEALRADATDYIQKKSESEQYELLANRIQNAVSQYRSETRLRETKKEYVTVFEGALTGLLLVDVERDGFRYQRCNRRAVELIGQDRDDIVGSTPSETLGEKMAKRSVGHIESVSSVVNLSDTPLPLIFQTDRPSDRAGSHPSNWTVKSPNWSSRSMTIQKHSNNERS